MAENTNKTVVEEHLIFGKYKLIKKIDEGSFGELLRIQ